MADNSGSQNTISKHVRDSSFLLTGRLISIVVNFLVQVLTVRYLSKSDYGELAYGLSMVSLGASIAVFGLDKTVSRFVPIYEEKKEYGKVFGTLILMVGTILFIGLLLVVALFGLQTWIQASLIKDPMAFSLLLILSFLAPLYALDSLLVGVFAIFSDPKTIFFRRYIIGPGLKLLVIVVSILFRSDVYFLARGYLLAGILGIGYYFVFLIQIFRKTPYFREFKWSIVQFPAKEIFSFSVPLLTTDVVFLMRHSMVVFFLEYFGNVTDVAAYRAVLPVARINSVVLQSFSFLYLPMASRMFATKDDEGINQLYWRSTAWIALVTFPVFLVTGILAEPTTVLLFSDRYQNSAIVMTLLSLGYYFDAMLGLNAITLRVWGKVKMIITNDVIAMIVSLGLNLLLIPKWGALGGAIGACATLIIHNILNHISLQVGTSVNLFDKAYTKLYVWIVLSGLAIFGIQNSLHPSIFIGIFLVILTSLIVILANRDVLDLMETFPELMKIKIVARIFTLLRITPRSETVER